MLNNEYAQKCACASIPASAPMATTMGTLIEAIESQQCVLIDAISELSYRIAGKVFSAGDVRSDIVTPSDPGGICGRLQEIENKNAAIFKVLDGIMSVV